MPLASFHPAVAAWFAEAFSAPTPAQREAWRAIQSGHHTLIAAPTGSGKTLAAFLAAIDTLVRAGLAGNLADATQIVYVSPLKALSNDVCLNLEAPIAGIRNKLRELGLADVALRVSVRSGDTPQAERGAMRRRPPHIVVTTPESLYILLGSASGRQMLATTRTVIVDEIHVLAPSKRGAHLALSLERLEALCGRALVRIGLSATQKPIAEVARFLLGHRPLPAEAASGDSEAPPVPLDIVDLGYTRPRDLALELPPTPLAAVMSGEAWQLIYTRLVELIEAHRTTLIFVNTRRMAERVAHHLSARLGKDAVTAHHGSLAREQRLAAEQRLKRGELRALVATASLELGIDVGEVDLVCQLGSPRSIATFLQRAGRANHAVGGTPKARLFPLSRDDLVECAALLDAIRRGELDTLRIVRNARDVLAQHIVAEVACREWREEELFQLVRRAHPFATLEAGEFRAIVHMLAYGFTTRRGPRAAYLHRDAVHGVLRARRGARLTALTSGGAIPDTADYEVVLEPQALRVGTVHEDFAVESTAGDIFQLGNTSYRVLRVERGRVRVEDAQGAPPTMPFWLGEAPGRSDELSYAVSRLRAEIGHRLTEAATMASDAAALRWLCDEIGLDPAAARQIVDYLGAAQAAFGMLPTQTKLAMERFFDESGGTQLVIHSPYGSRINRAWGLALRKRFCRTFNFELQAAATEDAIVLSLSTSHSFPLDDVTRYLHSSSVRRVLTQALLDAPMFGVRWRWNATTSLALPRCVGGVRVAPQLQRMKAEDLLATVFPDQVACLENIVGERQIPDHPLVTQTLEDCLFEAMDLAGLERLLHGIEEGRIQFVCRDLTAPSPLASEVLQARPYAFLDDAPLEERRTQAVFARRFGDLASTDDFGGLDRHAIEAVRAEAWPEAKNADELHDALLGIGFLTSAELIARPDWSALLEELIAQRRATRLQPLGLVLAAERIAPFQALWPGAKLEPPLTAPAEFAAVRWTRETALTEILRARLTGLGPVTAADLAATVALPAANIDAALLALEREGTVLRGRFTAEATSTQWCERHLLARIHRYTVHRLRREIEPVAPRDFLRFLFEWQHLAPDTRLSGPDGLAAVLTALEGYEAPAAAWETEILPARVSDYDLTGLDDLCQSGRTLWIRLRDPEPSSSRRAGPIRATPIVLLQRRNLYHWTRLPRMPQGASITLSARAELVAAWLQAHGACFFDEIALGTGLLHAELEQALAELVAAGRVHADRFAGLRALLVPAAKRPPITIRVKRQRALLGIAEAGRWALFRRAEPNATMVGSEPDDPARAAASVEHVARVLLRRYGVVCARVLAREATWLPPWRELLRCLQRLEARGEIRGGRFIAGLAGEQFALPEAVGLLREVRRRERDGSLIAVSGADPLNLVGILLAGPRVPASVGARVLYRDGIPIATRIGGEFHAFETLDPSTLWTANLILQRDVAARDRVVESRSKHTR